MGKVVMTKNFGDYAKGQVVEVDDLMEWDLVKRYKVAITERLHEAQKAMKNFEAGSAANRKRVNVTTVTEGEVRNHLLTTNKDYDEAVQPIVFNNGEFPVFNTCTHTLVDLSSTQDDTITGTMQTVSIKLPNGDYLTVALIPFENLGQSIGCIDIKYHGDKQQKIIGFTKGGNAGEIENFTFHTLTYQPKATE